MSFEDRFPTATVKFLVGSEEVKNHLLQTLGELEASEQKRAQNEELRLRNEEIRDAFEMGRQRDEDERNSNEELRAGAEQYRSGNEARRITAENGRVTAESQREDAEYDRNIKESERKNNEAIRISAERTRGSNEDLRIAQEDERLDYEADRRNRESDRVSNEATRNDAERSRVEAEEARVLAEQSRDNAEQKRADNDIQRGVLLQEHDREINEHANSIAAIESDVKDLGDAPRSEVDNLHYRTIHLIDRASNSDIYPITIPEAVVDEDGNNVLDIIKRYWVEGNTESDVMYGVEWDVTVAATEMTRIGNMALHRQLPIHNRMKGCLLDDNGNVVEYLNPTTWEGATRDGSRGQVMVEVPDHYRKFETDGNIRRTKISEYPLPGYHYVPKMYISAYEAALQRSTNKLCSVRNSDPDYRGGGNQSEWDGTYRSMLGLPVSKIKRSALREAARNRKTSSTEWNIYTYESHKTLCWLYLIEYANLNCQLAFNASADANGYKQGGLGEGVTNMSAWGGYNNYDAFIPCGVTDSLGNGTGVVAHNVLGEDGAAVYAAPVPRYRGIENPFGHLEMIVDGASISDGAIYVARDPALFGETLEGYTKLVDYGSGGFIKDIYFGEYGDIVATEVGGASNQYWADQIILQGEKIVAVGGNSVNGRNAGLNCMNLYYSEAATRLCFIPQNNE